MFTPQNKVRQQRRLLVSIIFILGICFSAFAGPKQELEQNTNTLQQAKSISGVVKDETGEIVIGATIRVKGVDGGTITGMDGTFAISVNDPNAILVISFVGMKDKEVILNGSTNVDVVLESTVEAMEELVVVGYGTQKKQSVVAAISSISAAEIVSTPTSNIVSGLAGKMPGLNIMLKDGELGSEDFEMLIRGQATMNNSAPLVLVDGVERPINDIDPYDVETVNILKDASATAVYGVRGANGVIIVTTKKGIEGKPKVTANLNYSLQNTTRDIDPMNAIDYMNTRNDVIRMENARTGVNTALPYSDQIFQYYEDNYLPEFFVDRDFQKEFIRKNVPMAKANVNIRGGSKRTKYFASVGYTRQGGPFKTEKWDEYNYDNEQRLDRLTYRANIDMDITESLRGWINLAGSLQDKNDPVLYVNTQGVFASSYDLLLARMIDAPATTYPDLSPEGDVVGAISNDRTPYGMLNRTGYKTTTKNNINTTIGFEQKLDKVTKGLSVKAKLSYDSNVSHSRGFSRTYTTYLKDTVPTATGLDPVYVLVDDNDTNLKPGIKQDLTERTNFELSANYNRSLNKKHDVSGMFLFMRNKRVVNNKIPYNYVGIVGRATYGYKNKYLTEFNFGMNGSEQFAKGNRFGLFPSLSAGWVLSEENFIKQVSAIDFLKIRGSFGRVGNDKMTNPEKRFLYVPNWAQDYKGWMKGLTGISGLQKGVYQELMNNPGIQWEVANKYNLGFESRFFSTLEFDLDVFYEERTSILITESNIPEYMFGQADLPPTNTGEMNNRGFETTLGYTKTFENKLMLGARYSMSYAHNIVVNKNELPFDDSYASPYRDEGFSRGTQWGYDCLGYFESQEEIDNHPSQVSLGSIPNPGDLKYRDANVDGVIDEKDIVRMDHPSTPELNYSFSLFGNYKGFDCNVLLTAVSNYSYNILGRGIEDYGGNDVGGINNYFEHHKNAWTPERAETGDFWYPRMYPSGISGSKKPSNFWIIDTWYLRIKNVEFGYTLPKHVLNNIGVKNLRLFVTGSNLALWDNLPVKTLDPETKNSISHPIYSTYNFGLNVSF